MHNASSQKQISPMFPCSSQLENTFKFSRSSKKERSIGHVTWLMARRVKKGKRERRTGNGLCHSKIHRKDTVPPRFTWRPSIRFSVLMGWFHLSARDRSLQYFSLSPLVLLLTRTRIVNGFGFKEIRIAENRGIEDGIRKLLLVEFRIATMICISILYYTWKERRRREKERERKFTRLFIRVSGKREFLRRVAKRRISSFSFNACDNGQGPFEEGY